MKKYITYFASLFLVGSVACTSMSEGGNAERDPALGYNQRVQHPGSPGGNNLDRLHRDMSSQSSDINRKRNIEEPPNGPATTPELLRPNRVPNAPIDSVNHQTPWPQSTRVEP